MATAQVLFQRFYYAKSFIKYSLQVCQPPLNDTATHTLHSISKTPYINGQPLHVLCVGVSFKTTSTNSLKWTKEHISTFQLY